MRERGRRQFQFVRYEPEWDDVSIFTDGRIDEEFSDKEFSVAAEVVKENVHALPNITTQNQS